MTANQIKAFRDRVGLTQVELSRVIGVHEMTVSKWERGITVPTPHEDALLEHMAAKKQPKPSRLKSLFARYGEIKVLATML